MPRESLLENLRTNQAFDGLLKGGSEPEKVVEKWRDSIMFEKNAERRSKKIAAFREELSNTFKKETLAKAHDLGRANARRLLSKLPGATPIGENQHTRRLALQNLVTKGDIRSGIVDSAVKGSTVNLEERLNQIWAEPADGGVREKLKHLREENRVNEEKRKKFEKGVVEFDKGERESRPAKPHLDFVSEVASDVKLAMREQARRAATDAELALYAREGYEQFVWIAPNGDEACPDCRLRAGVVGSMAYWEARGRPGSGRTVCKLSCYCSLSPAEILDVDPSFRDQPTLNSGGVLTTHSDKQSFNQRKE